MVTVTTHPCPRTQGICLCPHPSPCPINKKGTRMYRAREGREGRRVPQAQDNVCVAGELGQNK